MGRRRTKQHDLPPRLHRKGNRYYYVTTSLPRKWIALGGDLNEARRKWAELEGQETDPDDKTFRVVAARYEREIIPTKAYRTQKDNVRQLKLLIAAFGHYPIDEIRPVDVAEYMQHRGQTARVQANREKALLSHIYNHARAWGYTIETNPCAGIKGHKEKGRDRYISDAEYKAVWLAADAPTRDAMDLALLTGQRPADVLKMTRTDIDDGALHIRQNKTGKRIAIEISGELETVIARIVARPGKSASLVIDDDGEPLSQWSLRHRFDAARKTAGVDFQFRDIRAKAATDTGDLAHAQRLLGHKTRTMTEHYTRDRKGDRVKPLR
ncbi:Integrase [Georgfuchsia toluolica]|uniref:Integrase n=1 Tax=Georgfuchsia toluolica TaxID=424218 RepID=A0A916J347_9PROT|nr:tyrosine-type recombinase/integrase [Georgfuchsia toluolica]CAG4883717.1 Integrase [Georgfuchsia toluolica]